MEAWKVLASDKLRRLMEISLCLGNFINEGVYPSARPSDRSSVCLFVRPSVRPSYLSICVPVYLACVRMFDTSHTHACLRTRAHVHVYVRAHTHRKRDSSWPIARVVDLASAY